MNLPNPEHTPRRRLKRTKIVATVGPASDTLDMLRRLADAGVNVFRLNFSHGTHEGHLKVIHAVRQVCVEISRPLAILGDLCGPKLRLLPVLGDKVEVEEGDVVTLTSDSGDGTDSVFGVNIPDFHLATRPGEAVLIDDGAIRLTVLEVAGRQVRCRVENRGAIQSRKGINLPSTKLPVPALTEKDRADLAFALRHDVDLVALSFVRTADDIREARQAMVDLGRVVPLLAKIEKAEAVESLEEIVSAADGAMVARGDLGIEMPIEGVPAVQKRVIQLCNRQHKPVITATQMLDSMMRNPRPTRAEVTDIFNAILDGTDAVMLSGETAAGGYPLEAVEVMRRVALEAESSLTVNLGPTIKNTEHVHTTSGATAFAAVTVAALLKAECILIPTWSGQTARFVARYRPGIPVFACSTRTEAVNPLCLAWGVYSRIMAGLNEEEMRASESDAIVNATVRCAREHGFVKDGDRVVVLAGVPLGQTDSTNFLRVITV